MQGARTTLQQSRPSKPGLRQSVAKSDTSHSRRHKGQPVVCCNGVLQQLEDQLECAIEQGWMQVHLRELARHRIRDPIFRQYRVPVDPAMRYALERRPVSDADGTGQGRVAGGVKVR
jgi:hypothetical protein